MKKLRCKRQPVQAGIALGALLTVWLAAGAPSVWREPEPKPTTSTQNDTTTSLIFLAAIAAAFGLRRLLPDSPRTLERSSPLAAPSARGAALAGRPGRRVVP